MWVRVLHGAQRGDIMPATSKNQWRMMMDVMEGKLHVPGLSKEEASHFVTGVNPKHLPEKKTKKKRKP